MNINFGDTYFEGGASSLFYDIGITSIGGLIGFLGALYIYRLTQKSDNNKTIKRELNEQKDALIYFYRLSNGAIEHLEHLYEQIQVYVKKQRDNYSQIRRLETAANNDINRIKNIDSLMVFKAYRKFFNKKTNPDWIIDYKMIYSHLDSIEGIEAEIRRLDNENASQMKVLADSIKNNVDSIRPKIVSITSDFFIHGAVPPERAEEFAFLIGVLEKYQNLASKAIDLNELAECFFQPMMQKLMNSYSKAEYYHELMSIGQISRTQIADFLRIIEKHCKTMEELNTRFPNTISNLQSKLEKIKKEFSIED